jgi:hypothetical protein
MPHHLLNVHQADTRVLDQPLAQRVPQVMQRDVRSDPGVDRRNA